MFFKLNDAFYKQVDLKDGIDKFYETTIPRNSKKKRKFSGS